MTVDESRKEFWKAAARFLMVLTASAVPALVGWVNAHTTATLALSATAQERATSDAAYEKVVNRLNQLEAQLTVLRNRDTEMLPAPASAALESYRPTPNKEAVRTAQRNIELELR
jgi:hypothetical protein